MALVHDKTLRGRTRIGWLDSHHTFSFRWLERSGPNGPPGPARAERRCGCARRGLRQARPPGDGHRDLRHLRGPAARRLHGQSIRDQRRRVSAHVCRHRRPAFRDECIRHRRSALSADLDRSRANWRPTELLSRPRWTWTASATPSCPSLVPNRTSNRPCCAQIPTSTWPGSTMARRSAKISRRAERAFSRLSAAWWTLKETGYPQETACSLNPRHCAKSRLAAKRN